MKRYKAHLFALGVITAWGLFSYAYLGIEDGSSGFSALGWIHAAYFIPGCLLVTGLKGSYSNADLPLIAGIGWLLFSLLALALAQLACVIHRKIEKRDRHENAV